MLPFSLEVLFGIGVMSAIQQVLFERISPRMNLWEFLQRHELTETRFQNLMTTMLKVNAVLSDAEEKQITNLFVRQWLDELKDTTYHTADFLDEIHSLALAKSQGSDSPYLKKLVQKHIPKLKEMTDKLENIAKHKDVLGLKASFSGKPSPRLQLTSLVDETEGQGGSSIKELGELLHLGGKLSILQLQNVGDAKDAEDADLKKKKNIKELEFSWSRTDRADEGTNQTTILENLHPPENIEKLSIKGECRLLQFEDTMDYPQLQDLSIKSCDFLKKLTLNFSSHLKTLKIHDCGYLRFLKISDNLHQDLNFFRELEIIKCPYLEIFSGRGLPAPNLTSFSVSSCNSLRSMPLQMCTLLASLQTLDISGCPKLVFFPNGGLPPSLQILTIKNCVNLTPQNAWGLRNMTSLICLTIECAYANVTSFPDEHLLPASLTCLQIIGFPGLITLNLSGLRHLTLLKSLEIHSCNRLQFLSGDWRLPSSLSSLKIVGCSSQLTEQCQRVGGIYWDKISHIETQSITATN
ncbi:hypothetical protein LWI29_015372 [Acer saccharum]|uniref:Rx N-terminal domain-containing protein n=1 Tax=Acer saccharum TaxID=4024 RepID=A0AA39UTI9_ACESA|nr:hypothetical protein LWI29_015372 [Acer saccharum]